VIGEHFVFDVGAWLGALLTTWLGYRWRFGARVDAVAGRLGAGYFLALSGGGLLGAYGFGTWNAYLSGQPGIGRSILGGLAGAILLVELYKARRGIRGSTGAVFALPFAVALAIGRVGCYLSGLDDFTYGLPTDLPWGVDFGDGVARHPVQLYESLVMAGTAAVLLAGFARRQAWLMANGFYVVVAVYALQRFAWEFLKPYAAVIGPFNLFHLLCTILAAYAVSMVARGTADAT
jgi:prolipoprotein diacylglyceryltransferase